VFQHIHRAIHDFERVGSYALYTHCSYFPEDHTGENITEAMKETIVMEF